MRYTQKWMSRHFRVSVLAAWILVLVLGWTWLELRGRANIIRADQAARNVPTLGKVE